MTPQPTTLCEAFQRTTALDPSAVALRTVGDAQTLTWREYADKVRAYAAGLAGLGVGHGDTVALMLTNRPEFAPVDTAAIHLGAIPYSVYNTSSPEQISYLLENSQSRVMVCERVFLDRVRAAGGPVEHIIVVDDADENSLSLEQLVERGDPAFDFEAAWRAVRADDVATLIYTSGTTGDPKGVELTHAGVLAEIDMLHGWFGWRRGDRYTSYLPAAHVADRVSSHYVQMVFGTQVTFVADPKKIAEALPEVRPNYWFGVPRVWEKIKLALEVAFAEAEGPKAKLLHEALVLGRKRATGNLNPLEKLQFAVLDHLVLSKVRAKLGFTELRFAFSGAAAIAPETLEFFMALGVKIAELWGMSETTGVATANPLDKIKVGTVGRPLAGVELRVEDDGELLVRGPIVMRGYRNDPERTAEALDEDRWLRTGDVVTIDGDGYVKIVDRKKELIISAAGKNMSPANIENTLKAYCPLIGQAVTIGDGRPFNTVLIVLDPDVAAAFAGKHGIGELSPAALAENELFVEAVAAGLAVGNAKLSRVEQVKRFRILPEFWEPGGDQITPTMKLKRRPIGEKYAAEIDGLYGTPGDLVHEVPNTRLAN